METYYLSNQDSKLLCCAIHNGHQLRQEIKEQIGLSEEARFFEEDPLTEFFTAFSDSRLIQLSSRFEYDVNRSPAKAVYQKPEDCWGLEVYPKGLSVKEAEISLEKYKQFYERIRIELEQLLARHSKLFVWDIHSFNNRGRTDISEDQDYLDIENEIDYSNEQVPDICLGLSNINESFTPLIKQIGKQVAKADFFGRRLSVAYNHPFPGGYFPQWINHFYGDRVCALSIEFNKRIFMEASVLKVKEQDAVLNIPNVYRLREIFTETFALINDYLE